MNVHLHGVNRTGGLTHHETPHATLPHHPLELACPFTDASVTVSVWLGEALGLAGPAGTTGSAGFGAAGGGVAVAGGAAATPDGCPATSVAVSSGVSASISAAARRR